MFVKFQWQINDVDKFKSSRKDLKALLQLSEILEMHLSFVKIFHKR